MATSELSRGKTIFVLTVVAGCFAVLWPKIFYPMFFGSPQFQTNVEKAHGGPPQLNGCCDVYFEKDIQTLKIITQLCEENVLLNAIANSSRPLSKVAMLNLCYRQLQETCNIDLSNVFKMNQRHELDSSFKQFISIVRTFNSSLCLKYHYNVNFNVLGTPRIINSNVMKPTSLINAKKVDKDKNEKESMTDDGLKSQMRQERPPHMRPEMLHPALRENGRAIPHEHIVPRVEPDPVPRPVKQPGGPKPGMGRPAFGGGGPHAAKQGGGGIMNLLMPMYTISIVAFFIYTMLRIWDPMVMFVKLVLQFVSNSSNNARDGRNASSTDYYSSSTTELRSTSYYQEEYCAPGNGAGKKQLPEPDAKPAAPAKEQEKPGSKLVVCAISGLLEQVNREILDSNPGLVSTEPSQDAPLAEDKSDSISSNVAKTSDSHTSGVTSKTPTPESRQNSILEVEINDYEDVKQVIEKQKAKEDKLKEKEEAVKDSKEVEKKGVKFVEEKIGEDIKDKAQNEGGKVPRKKVNFGTISIEEDDDKVFEDNKKVFEDKSHQRNIRFIEEEKSQETNTVLDRKLDKESVEQVKKIIEEEIVQRAIDEVSRGLETSNNIGAKEVSQPSEYGTKTSEAATKPFGTHIGIDNSQLIKTDDELIKENIEKISKELQKTIISSGEHDKRNSPDFGTTKLHENGHAEKDRTENGHRHDDEAEPILNEKDRMKSAVHEGEFPREATKSHEKPTTAHFFPQTNASPASDDRVNAAAVQVIGMDRTESLVGGQKWDLGRRPSPPPRSVTPEFRPVTPELPVPAAHRIVLDGLVLPAGADKILITDTETESSVTDGGDSDEDSVVLSSKVTLSLLPGGAGGPAEDQVRKWMEDQKERKN
uniref:Resistance to inhibitors of cholinesterase protein 3 N-terminal domain-containing protein n=1 Tax=Cacopsylla melanoneura TaxID=428564 RepID=A0A8D8TK61_9HEMI